jgi:hypothetical protein
VYDGLRRLVRDRLGHTGGAHLVEAALDRLSLEIDVPLGEAPGGEERFASALIEGVDRLLQDAVEQSAAFRPGRAFCLRCGAADCEHASVPSARHVFAGYTPTGVPRWEDFAQVCLDRRLEEVDRLFEDPPAFVTLSDPPGALDGRVVRAFRGEGRFELLGQVLAGFYPVRTREGEGRGVLALTLQAAAWRGRQGAPRFGLNVIGRAPQGGPLDLLWEREGEIPWQAAVRWAQSALTTLARRRRPPDEVARRVEGILRGLARRLERDRRARSRRTRHAEHRHASGERPTRKAQEDSRRVRTDRVYVDDRHGTFVIAGERGRTHFYTAEGKLVSSVRYSRDAIDRKIKLGLWKEVPAPEVEGVLARIAGG